MQVCLFHASSHNCSPLLHPTLTHLLPLPRLSTSSPRSVSAITFTQKIKLWTSVLLLQKPRAARSCVTHPRSLHGVLLCQGWLPVDNHEHNLLPISRTDCSPSARPGMFKLITPICLLPSLLLLSQKEECSETRS